MSWRSFACATSKAVSPSYIILLCIIQCMLGGEVRVSKTRSIQLLILSHSWVELYREGLSGNKGHVGNGDQTASTAIH